MVEAILEERGEGFVLLDSWTDILADSSEILAEQMVSEGQLDGSTKVHTTNAHFFLGTGSQVETV